MDCAGRRPTTIYAYQDANARARFVTRSGLPRSFPFCLPHTRRALCPPSANFSDSSAAPFRQTSGGLGSVESNGVPSISSFPMLAVQGHGVGSGTGPSAVPVGTSTRSNFQSILKRGYLGEFLFVVIGSAICGALAFWTIGTSLRRFNPYSFVIVMPLATGVQLGTPLRMKGVPMGSVLSATPMLDRVHVEVEVNEAKTIIPRNARFDLTQSGLIPAPSIDITTPEGASAEALTAVVAARAAEESRQHGGGTRGVESGPTAVPARAKRPSKPPKLASPRDVAACSLQGVLVCHGDEVMGHVGGSMDELMAHMLKSLRQGENESTSTGIVPGRGPLQG